MRITKWQFYRVRLFKLIIPPNRKKIYRYPQCGRIDPTALSFFLFGIFRIDDIRYLEPMRKAAA